MSDSDGGDGGNEWQAAFLHNTAIMCEKLQAQEDVKIPPQTLLVLSRMVEGQAGLMMFSDTFTVIKAYSFADKWAEDIERFMQHRKKKTIFPQDVKLLGRGNKNLEQKIDDFIEKNK